MHNDNKVCIQALITTTKIINQIDDPAGHGVWQQDFGDRIRSREQALHIIR